MCAVHSCVVRIVVRIIDAGSFHAGVPTVAVISAQNLKLTNASLTSAANALAANTNARLKTVGAVFASVQSASSLNKRKRAKAMQTTRRIL